MGWTQVGTGTAATITAGAGNQTVSMPGTTKRGDLVIVAVAGDISCQNSVQTAGYNAVENGTGANPGAHFAYKVLTAAETGVDIARDGTILKSCVVQVWSGGNAASIVDAAYITDATGTSANPNATAITVVGANSLVVQVAYLDDDDATVNTYPSGYSNGISANTGQTSTTVGSTVAICSLVRSAGTEDAGAWTMSSSDAWQASAISFALQQPLAPVPTVGAVAIAGYAPTVTVPKIRAPTVGALAVTGYAPSLTLGRVQTPLVASVAVAGYAPALAKTDHHTCSPAADAAAITGYAPTVTRTNHQFRTPTVAALALTGYAPTAAVGGINSWAARYAPGANNWFLRFGTGAQALAPSVGALALAGYAPTVTVSSAGVTRAPTVGALAITGYGPSLGRSYTFAPAAGGLALAGYAPTASTSSAPILTPAAAALGITGYAPLKGISYTLTPTVGAVALTGYAPTLGMSLARAPSVASVAVTGYAPTVGQSQAPKVFTPATAQLGVTGKVPTPISGGTLIVTFPFLANAQSFVGTPGAGTTMAWTGANGNPLGSLSTRTTGSGRNVTNVWTRTTDWITLGVPANKVITSITAASAQSRVTEFTGGAAGGSVSVTNLTPTGVAAIQLALSRSISGIEGSWTTSNGAGATGLQINSNGSLAITAGSNLRTTSGGSGKAVTLLQDNVTFTVTYTSSKNLRPEVAGLALTGYAPTLARTVTVNSWFRRLTSGANTWALRSNVGPDQGAAPAATTLAISGYAPTVTFGNPIRNVPAASMAIVGYAPSIAGNPIVLLGADVLESGPATITVGGTHIVKQNDHIRNVAVGSLAITGYAPSLRRAYAFTPVAVELQITGYAPVLQRDYTLAAPVAELAITGYAPGLSKPETKVPTVAALALAGYAPELTLSGSPKLPVSVTEAAITGYAPTVFASLTLAPSVGAAEITGYAPTLENTHRIVPEATVLGVTGEPIGIKPRTVDAVLQSQAATTAGSGFVTRFASGVLHSAQPLAFSGTGPRVVTGGGTLQSGPASLHGDTWLVVGQLLSGPARLLARVQLIPYEPLPRRLKPERVNRYTVALKPSPRHRVRRPNTRKPPR